MTKTTISSLFTWGLTLGCASTGVESHENSALTDATGSDATTNGAAFTAASATPTSFTTGTTTTSITTAAPSTAANSTAALSQTPAATHDDGNSRGSSGVSVSSADTSTTQSGPASNATQTTATGQSSTAASGVASSSDATSSDDATLAPLAVYIAGDSTVSTYRDTESTTDQAGWGQMLSANLSDLVQVENRAVGGTTARSFIDFGHLEKIATDITAGDVLLVQFGTNDGNKTATYDFDGQEIPYYLDPATDFKTYLTKYIELAQSKAAHLVFVTPPPRNSAYCTGGNGTGGHAQAMRELGEAQSVPVADLNTRSVDHLTAICPSPTPEDFFLLRADGSVDGTHFQEHGAQVLAALVADEIAALDTPLANYVVASP